MCEHVFILAHKSNREPHFTYTNTHVYTHQRPEERLRSREDYEFWAERQKTCLKSSVKSPGVTGAVYEFITREKLCVSYGTQP